MNKAIRLSAMAAACALFAVLSATEVKADDLLITSDQELSILNPEIITTEEVLAGDCVSGAVYTEEGSGEILLTDSGISYAVNEVVIEDNNSTGGGEVLLVESPRLESSVTLSVGREDELTISSDLYNNTYNDTSVIMITDSKSSGSGNHAFSTGSDWKSNGSINKSADIDCLESSGSTLWSAASKASLSLASSSDNLSYDSSGSNGINGNSSNSNGNNNNINNGRDLADNAGSSYGKGASGSSSSSITDTMRRMLDSINKRRVRAGLCRLTFSEDLNKIASLRVNEATKKFSHTRANGKNWVSILNENGIEHGIAGENLACRISDPEQVVAAWSASPSHNRCMMNGEYTHAGIGTVTVNGCTYWTLILTD